MVWRLVLAMLLVGGCRITPDEIEQIEVENVLLREQIQVIRENCEYYRELDLRALPEEGEAEPEALP